MPLSAIRPELYSALLEEKADRVAGLLAPWYPSPSQVHASPPTGFRMRAEFRVWHEGDRLDYVMFPRNDSRSPVRVGDFIIAHATIRELMPHLLEALRSDPVLRRRLFQVEFLATLAGDILVTLVYHRALDGEWEARAAVLRESLEAEPGSLQVVGRSRRQKLVLGRDYVRETLAVDSIEYRYRQYEQSFTQPNTWINQRMLEWAVARAREFPHGDLLELYCGNGNFTLPLSRCFGHVIATEVAKISARAARENLEDNGISNVHLVRMAAEEVASALDGVREFRRLDSLPGALRDFQLDTLFVDPPRAGLDPATLAMAARFPRVIYISCNPGSLAANLETLGTTHSVTHLALFDQFPYTPHMECGVVLERSS